MIQTPHTWIEISRNALLHNLYLYKKAIGSNALGVVVKSNAYGHGIVEDRTHLPRQALMLIGFSRQHLSEALILRNAGYHQTNFSDLFY